MASAGEISPASGTNLYIGDQVNFSCTATFDYPERCSSIFYNFYGNDSSGNRTFYVADSEEYSGYNAQITFSHSVTIPASTARVYAYIGFSYSTTSWYYTIERTAEYPCGTRDPVITKQPVLSLGSKARLMIDLAVPRDIEPAVGEIEGVELHDIDFIKSISEENNRKKSEQREHMYEILEEVYQDVKHEMAFNSMLDRHKDVLGSDPSLQKEVYKMKAGNSLDDIEKYIVSRGE